MKTITKVLTGAAVLVVALSLSVPTGADCGNASPITTNAGAGARSFIFSPPFADHASFSYGASGAGAPQVYDLTGVEAPRPLGPDATISFWKLGFGDPAVGAGIDNGGFDMLTGGGISYPNGFYYYGYGLGGGAVSTYSFFYGGTIVTSWDNSTDGCIENANCMCLLVTDQDGADGFFALVSARSSSTFSTELNRVGTSDGAGHNLPIQLVSVDAPRITGSIRDAVTNDVALSVMVSAPTGGLYQDPTCNCGPVGYKVLQMILPSGNMPPSNRSLAPDVCVSSFCGNTGVPCVADGDCPNWHEPDLTAGGPQGVTALGATVGVTSGCGAANTDVYLTTQLVLDSGFTTTLVSGNSTQLECGPTLANPTGRPRPDRPGRDRPQPRGRKR